MRVQYNNDFSLPIMILTITSSTCFKPPSYFKPPYCFKHTLALARHHRKQIGDEVVDYITFSAVRPRMQYWKTFKIVPHLLKLSQKDCVGVFMTHRVQNRGRLLFRLSDSGGRLDNNGVTRINKITLRTSSRISTEVGTRSCVCQYLTCHSTVSTGGGLVHWYGRNGVFYEAISPVSRTGGVLAL